MSRFRTGEDLFPPEKSLLSLPIVHRVFWSLALVALVMSIGVLRANWPMHLDWSNDGFKTAAELFQAPIAVILLLIPFLALLASNHRSVQTMKQMELTTTQITLASNQNLFANYFKHAEEFGKFCDTNFKAPVYVTSKRRAHAIFFPQARNGDFRASEDAIEEVERFVKALWFNLSNYAKSDPVAVSSSIQHLTRGFAPRFFLGAPAPKGNIVASENIRLSTPGSIHDFIQEYLDFTKMVEEILAFDPEYRPTILMYRLLQINVSNIPDHVNFSPTTRFELAEVDSGVLSMCAMASKSPPMPPLPHP